MKKSLKNIITVFLLSVSMVLFAQKQSKDFKETFNVKKDAVVEINASHADVEVTTWNKNQVQVEATIEIDGLTKEEAEKYLKNFRFEALGNSGKVQITVGGNNSFSFGNNDFIIFDPENFVMPDIVIPDVVIPDFNFQMPDINIPEIDFQMPDMDWEKFIIDLDDIEFDFDRYSKDGKNYFFRWKDSVRDITIKNKKDWEKFKKSKEYKEWKVEMEKEREKMKKEIKEELKKAQNEIQSIDLGKIIGESLKAAEKAMENVDVEGTVKQSLEEARKAMREVDRDKIRKELAEVRRQFRNSYRADRIYDNGENELIINDKKVKIKKKVTIKVPKGVTLDLNTRHCKLKLPKMSASGKVSYGSFNASGLEGGDLNIYYAPVQINSLANAKLNLKNVTDATLASVRNSSLKSDSGELEILELFSGTNIEASFGEVTIKKVSSKLNNFNLTLNQSDANINLKDFNQKLKIDTKGNKGKITNYDRISDGGKGMLLRGNFSVSTNGDQLKITGKYSELTIKE